MRPPVLATMAITMYLL